MSLGLVGLHQLLPAFSRLPRTSTTRVLLLGVQDFTLTYDDVAQLFTSTSFPFHHVPNSDRRTTTGFGYVSDEQWAEYKDFIHQDTVFQMIGLSREQLQTLDVSNFEGANIIHDLNLALDEPLGEFDLVLNQGTLEHVFDVRQALWTISDLTRIGGEVVHMAPAGFLNHGFYNFNSLLFDDFYSQSMWERIETYYCLFPKETSGREQHFYARIAPDQLSSIPENLYVNVHCRYRKTERANNVLAVQGMYADLHRKWRSRRDTTTLVENNALTREERLWFAMIQSRRIRAVAEKQIVGLGATLFRTVKESDTNVEAPQVDVVEFALEPSGFVPEEGKAWTCLLNEIPEGDSKEHPQGSLVVLLEDGHVLGPPRSLHANVRRTGRGAYSHWGKVLYFSTSDGSSPQSNGRTYKVRGPKAWFQRSGQSEQAIDFSGDFTNSSP